MSIARFLADPVLSDFVLLGEAGARALVRRGYEERAGALGLSGGAPPGVGTVRGGRATHPVVELPGGERLVVRAYRRGGLMRHLPRAPSPGLAARAQWRWAEGVSGLAKPLFGSPTGWRGYALGLALGFIPCGLLYGAVAVASASGNPVSGALGMAAFAAGTIPSLLTVGLAGHAAGRSFRGVMSRVAPVVMAVNAGVLGYMAWRLVG